jgi:hypothetical protein
MIRLWITLSHPGNQRIRQLMASGDSIAPASF